MSDLRIAVIHFEKGSDIDENEQHLLDLNIQAAKGGADLIVNPELPIIPASSADSPLRRSSQAGDVAQSRAFATWFAKERGPTFIERLRAAVVTPHQTHVVVGTIRAAAGYQLLYNSALVVGPNGFEYRYDKRVLTSDVVYATPGTSALSPARLPLGNVGVVICGDYSAPLLSRSLALNGSDIIVIPAAITSPVADTLQVRALENGIPFALANTYDRASDWGGKIESAVISADGKIQACHDQRTSAILWADLDLADPITQRLRAERRHSRRPDLYLGALVDLTSSQLRASATPAQPEAWVITVSSAAVDRYPASHHLSDVLASASRHSIPVMLVLPELDAAKQDLQAHLRFAGDRKTYLACGYNENGTPMLSLYAPDGEEVITCRSAHFRADSSGDGQANQPLEQYVDLPFGRIGLLAGADLIYPEAVEVYRNAAVDLILAPARLDFDGAILFEDIAKYRHIHIAVADYNYDGGIYTRFPEAFVFNAGSINCFKFNIRLGQSRPANIPLAGLEAIVRIE